MESMQKPDDDYDYDSEETELELAYAEVVHEDPTEGGKASVTMSPPRPEAAQLPGYYPG